MERCGKMNSYFNVDSIHLPDLDLERSESTRHRSEVGENKYFFNYKTKRFTTCLLNCASAGKCTFPADLPTGKRKRIFEISLEK